ncbi:MAG: hypothetical protein OXL33_01655 [Chloroflexota bacterium]|nr:hypothetical protein [Chloroflexota bacterium]
MNPEYSGEQGQEGHDRERDQRQLPGKREHDDEDSDDHDQVDYCPDQALGHHLVEGIYVAQKPRQNRPGIGAVEKPQIEPLDLAEQLHPDVEHHALTDVAGYPHHRSGGAGRGQREHEVGDRHRGQQGDVASGDALVDRDADDYRLDHAGDGYHQREGAGVGNAPGAGHRVGEHAPEEAEVERRPGALDVVAVVDHVETSAGGDCRR